MIAGPPQEPTSLSLGMSLSSAKSAYPPAYPIWYDDEDEAEMLSVHAAPIPIPPSLFFIVTHRPAQRTAVQDTVQTPRKKTLTYRARLLLLTITAVVHMVPLWPRQHRR